MDPYFQQRLRDEVIYLHSLWHQGPPTSNPNPTPIPIPNPNPNPTNTNRTRPSRNERNPSQPDPIPHSDPQFPSTNRKRNRNTRNERERPNKKKNSESQPDPPSHSGSPWPCPSPTRESAPGQSLPWPTKPNSAPVGPPPSPTEQARLAALKLQQKALDFCRGLFSGNAGSDSESEDGGGDDYWDENGGESEEFRVFLNVFVENIELRNYYEVNYENGEFWCLVCGGLGKKKRVKGCVGLAQHSIQISNTKKKQAHRAFAKVVCKVLGWDFGRLPTIVLKGERLSLSLAKPGKGGEPEVNSGSCEGVSGAVQDSVGFDNDANAESGGKEVFDDHQNGNTELMFFQNSSKDDGTNKSTESVDREISDTEINKEAVDTRSEPGVNAGSSEDASAAVEENVAAENDANAELGEKETFDDQNKGIELIIFEKSLKDDGTNESTESIDKRISETEANKEVVDTRGPDQPLISRTGWPCEESNISSSTVLGWPLSWPSINSHSASATCSISVAEQARSATVLLQQKALNECQDYFAGKEGSDSDEDGSGESEELKFFSKVFTEDGELRNFYVNNYEHGEFCCLVCGGVGKKVWKRFKGCVALLQHSTAILKTKKKVAHRAYGQVICKVLGWDIGRIGQPPNNGSIDEPLDDGPSEKSDNLQGELEENAGDDKDNVVVSKENLDSMGDRKDQIVSKEESDVVLSNATSKTCELQGQTDKDADGENKDLEVFMESLDPL